MPLTKPNSTAISVQAVETPLFAVGGHLADFIATQVPRSLVRENMVLAVTSKIVSLAENRILLKDEAPSKEDLVRRECEHFLGTIGYNTTLTVAHGLLIPAAGIDESNAAGDFYILYPIDPYASAQKLWQELRERWGLKNLGVILTDSHTTPLRRGVTGIGLSFWGFEPTENLVGAPDLYGRPFKMTQINHVDALAGLAVYAMGEGTVPRPLAVVHGTALTFVEEDRRANLGMPLEEDLYFPILRPLLDRS